MSTLLLHIGTSKAGSTAIQQLATSNRAELSAHGIEYFPTLRRPNHAELAAAFCRGESPTLDALGFGGDRSRRKLRDRLAKDLRSSVSAESIWLASSEHLSTQLKSKAEIGDCAEFLGRYFDRVVVLLVLRRADYWLPSAYPQSVRSGLTGSFDAEYVRSRRRLLDHCALAARWASAFGKRQLRCVPLLESDKKSLHALPDRLLSVAGLGEVDVNWQQPLASPANPAMSAPATEVLRAANPLLTASVLRPSVTRSRAIHHIVERWPGPRIVLTPSAEAAVDEVSRAMTGIAETRYAAGDDWQEWIDQPPGPVAEPYELSAQDREAALDDLRQAGFIKAGVRSARLADAAQRVVAPLRSWSRRYRT